MTSPTLFIGLGGAGGQTLRLLKQELARSLATVGWVRDLPRGWAFRYVDSSPTEPAALIGAPPLAPGEYLGLRPEHLAGVTLEQIVGWASRSEHIMREVNSWVGEDLAGTMRLPYGVGAYRAVGRLVGLNAIRALVDGLSSALRDLGRVEVSAELAELRELQSGRVRPSDGTMEMAEIGAPKAIIVSSLSGGTGSALLLDVLEILKHLQDGIRTSAIHYTSEVLGTVAGDGGVPNMLASTCELINAMMRDGTAGAGHRGDRRAPPRSASLLARLGIVSSEVSRGQDPTSHYLVGPENVFGVSLGSANHVIGSVAGLLAAAEVNPMVEGFLGYGKERASRLALDAVSVEADRGMGATAADGATAAFGAAGFARVSLGTQEFRRYAAEKLASHAALLMLREPSEGWRPASSAGSVRHALVTSGGALLNDSQSTRLAQPSNDLLKSVAGALRPDAVKRRILDDLELIEEYLSHFPDADAGEWTRRILERTLAVQHDLDEHVAAEMDRVVAEWVSRVTADVVDSVEATIRDHGFVASIRDLESVIDEIDGLDADSQPLLARAQQLRSYSTREMIEGAITRELKDALSPGAMAADSADIRTAFREAVRHAQCGVLAGMTERPVLLIRSLADGLLRPMAAHLRSARSSLEELETGADSDSGETAPATRPLNPPPHEFFVIEPRDFAAIFASLLGETVGATTDEGLRRASMQVLGAGFLTSHGSTDGASSQVRRLVSLRQAWSPGREASGLSDGASCAAAFDIRWSADDLLPLADQWLMEPGRPFGALLTADLRLYTAGPSDGSVREAEIERRQEKVMALIDLAARTAAPPIRLSETAMSGLFADSPLERSPVAMLVSQMPFRSHPLEAAAVEWLEANNTGARSLVGSELPGHPQLDASSVSSIEFVGLLKHPIQPLAIESLMAPVADGWKSVQDRTRDAQGFWKLRRARQLGEFAPISQSHLVRMIRGWYTGMFLQLLYIDPELGRVSIQVDPLGSASSAQFPAPISLRGHDTLSALAGIIEAMPVAIISSTIGSGWLDEFAAYRALSELGMPSDPGQGESSYPTLHPLLQRWIDIGEPIPGLVDTTARRAESPVTEVGTGDSGRRLDILLGWIRRHAEQHVALVGEPARWGSHRGSSSAVSESVEIPTDLWLDLNESIVVALDELREATERQLALEGFEL